MLDGKKPTGRPPKFRHDAPAMQASHDGLKYLVQNGRKWSYAEYNKFTEKWEPEPRLLDDFEINSQALINNINDLKKLMSPFVEQFDLLKSIFNRLDILSKEMTNGKDKG